MVKDIDILQINFSYGTPENKRFAELIEKSKISKE